MADGPISPESVAPPGDIGIVETAKPPQQEAELASENKEVSPKRGDGVATRLAESQRLLGEAQEVARREFELQRNQFYTWVGEKRSEMPIVEETDGVVRRESVWHVEGEKAKRITLEERKSGTIEDLSIADIEQPGYELSVGNHRIKLQGGGFDQNVAFNYPLNAMEYSCQKITREPVSVVDQTPDIFGYSKGVLDFLNKAKMQPVAPTRPPSGQLTTPVA